MKILVLILLALTTISLSLFHGGVSQTVSSTVDGIMVYQVGSDWCYVQMDEGTFKVVYKDVIMYGMPKNVESSTEILSSTSGGIN